MNYSTTHNPTKLNMDRAFKKLNPDESFYMLNNETGINIHATKGSNIGKSMPMAANYPACDMELPGGENYAPHKFYAELTNEAYSWHMNSHGINHLQRTNGDGLCEVVYSGDCMPLSADPRHEITKWRAYMKVDKICHNQAGKQLIWVDGTDTPIGQIDVEASIATKFFTTPFFQVCPDPCAPLQMCVPEPNGCLNGEWIPYSAADAHLTNKMLDTGFKFMYRYVYYDQRASEWSDRSSLYFQDAKGCFDNSEGFSRCMKFQIPIGNPLVEIIQFAFSEDGGINWYLSDEIEKYNPYTSTEQQWYERTLAPNITDTFNADNCTFDYIFCNDKRRAPIDPLQVSRELNPIPREAQGIVRLKESIGFYNYKKGSCPIDKNEIDKFNIDVDCSHSGQACNTEYVKVTVRAIIYQASRHKNVFIYRLNGSDGGIDDPTDPAWFSDTHSPTFGHPYVWQGYDQTFVDTTRNFIVYIKGTDYWGEMVQWRGTPGFNINSRKKVGVLGGMAAGTTVGRHRDDIKNNNYYYQEYTFNVPKGMKGFLGLTSHHSVSGLGANQDTSTQVYMILDDIRTYGGNSALDIAGHPNNNEIYFDTCNGLDQDIFKAFVVEDFFTIDTAGTPVVQSSAYFGYITDKNNQPVEGALIYANGNYQVTTDYNGYYSFYIYDGTSAAIPIDIYVEHDCVSGFQLIESFTGSSDLGSIGQADYQIQSTTYQNDFTQIVKVPVTDCNSRPLPGIRVAISGGKYKVTGTDGIATFKLRNYQTRNRQVQALVMDRGNCFTIDCNGGCNPCMPSTLLTTLPACFQGTPSPVSIIAPTTQLNIANIGLNKMGLKHGGRYPFGWVLEGDCGRLSAVNITRYIDIPKLQDQGNLAFCSFSYSSTGLQLPSWGKRLKLVRGANLNPFELQWVVDSIERTTDSKIKLTIQSLNDYNAQYNFNSNTVYKYLQNDRVEFLRNGDGKVLDTATNGVLNYLTLSPYNDITISGVKDDVNYFNQLLIADDGKLDKLVPGAIIEIQRPASSATVPIYFEICASIAVEQVDNGDGTTHGELSIGAGTFNSFDTFLVNRQIAKFPVQTFESHTPSDFWGGTGLDDTGKVHFINKFENERRYGRNITINSPTQFNYFGDLEKTFSAAEQGDITALSVKDDKIGLGISENDNFLFEISDQLLRVSADNVIRATTADSMISNPEAKLRGKFGCAYEDIGSVFFGDGYATYIDSHNDAYIVHNYQFAKEAGETVTTVQPRGVIESTCNSYFRKRIREKENFNRTATNYLDHYRYATGIDKNTGKLFLTIKALRHSGINNEKAPYRRPNETIIYNPVNDTFGGFASFTPEGYSELNLKTASGCAMMVYQNSLAYIHPVIATKWNNFFGVACDWIVGISLNMFPNKIKIPLAMEVQSELMWYASSVTTETDTFFSEIPPVRFKKNERKWNAAFLNNINSRGALYSGENARGFAINIVMVRDNTIDLIYGSVNNDKREQYSELDSILIKFMTSESSGQTENL